jgi:hypothetical protein
MNDQSNEPTLVEVEVWLLAIDGDESTISAEVFGTEPEAWAALRKYATDSLGFEDLPADDGEFTELLSEMGGISWYGPESWTVKVRLDTDAHPNRSM